MNSVLVRVAKRARRRRAWPAPVTSAGCVEKTSDSACGMLNCGGKPLRKLMSLVHEFVKPEVQQGGATG